jgi:hypothetical protein
MIFNTRNEGRDRAVGDGAGGHRADGDAEGGDVAGEDPEVRLSVGERSGETAQQGIRTSSRIEKVDRVMAQDVY